MIHHGRAENNCQSRISGLVAFLSGQTLVLLVILSAHFWIWTFFILHALFHLMRLVLYYVNTAMMFFDLCYALNTFCNNLPSTGMSMQYDWSVTSIVWYYLGEKKKKKKLLQLFDQPEKEVVYYFPFVSYDSSWWSFS